MENSMGNPPKLIDLDNKSPTLHLFKGMDVMQVDLETDGEIDKMKFDFIIESLADAEADDCFILDTGSNTFPTLANYLKVNGVFQLLHDMEHVQIMHVPVMGGQELNETIGDLREIIEETPPFVTISVWINQFHGVVEYEGKNFEQSETYKEFRDRIRTITYVPRWSYDMQRDISEMLKAKLTFNEVQDDQSFRLMSRQRLGMAKRYLYSAIEKSGVCL